MIKKLKRNNLTSNAGDIRPEPKAPKGQFNGWTRSQIDRWQTEQEKVIAAKRTRRTLHLAGRYSLAKSFL